MFVPGQISPWAECSRQAVVRHAAKRPDGSGRVRRRADQGRAGSPTSPAPAARVRPAPSGRQPHRGWPPGPRPSRHLPYGRARPTRCGRGRGAAVSCPARSLRDDAVSTALVVTTGLGGNIPPMLGIATELRRRGWNVIVHSDDPVTQRAQQDGFDAVWPTPSTTTRSATGPRSPACATCRDCGPTAPAGATR